MANYSIKIFSRYKQLLRAVDETQRIIRRRVKKKLKKDNINKLD